MRQAARLSFACALAFFAAAIVLDRPTAGLSINIALTMQALGLFLMTLR
jgi:energy-coupling factor transporter ATP-binding protein EcfA2